MSVTPRELAGLILTTVLLAACGHSEPFGAGPLAQPGPFTTGPEIRLTFNSGADYEPSWTEDGAGILYLFSQPGHADDDRCVGLLPAGGGRQLWSMCDNTSGQTDSSSSIVGVALGTDGRLVYEEIIAKAGRRGSPDHMLLWLADSAAPFNRRLLLTFPVGGGDLRYLSNVAWIAQDQFVGLIETFDLITGLGSAIDTVITGAAVAHVTINATGATLALINGTSGAAEYALAHGGTKVVFYRTSQNIEQVPITGGTPSVVATIDTSLGALVGLSCKDDSCLVETTRRASFDLSKLSLIDGSLTLLKSSVTTWATPRIAPLSNDVVVRSGLKPTLDLTLFKGLMP